MIRHQQPASATWYSGRKVELPAPVLHQLEDAWKQVALWHIAQQVADPWADDAAYLDHVEQHLLEEVIRRAAKTRRAVLTNTGPLWTARPASFAASSERVDFEEAAAGLEWTRGTPLPFAVDAVWLMCRMSGKSIPLLAEEPTS